MLRGRPRRTRTVVERFSPGRGSGRRFRREKRGGIGQNQSSFWKLWLTDEMQMPGLEALTQVLCNIRRRRG